MKFEAVIFDMDGLLTDTERLHMVSYQKTLRNYSINLSEQEYVNHWITNGFGIKDFIKKHSLQIEYIQLRVEKVEVFQELLKTELRFMPYAREILCNLLGKKRIALASSSYRENVETILNLLNINKYFEVIVSGSEVSRSKPAPDVFLLAAKLLKVDPSNCIVLEDAQKGVFAANSAGMKVAAIPNVYTKDDDFSTSDYVMNSLQDAEKLILEN